MKNVKPKSGKSDRSPLFLDYIRERVAYKRKIGKFSVADVYNAAGNHFERFLGERACRLGEVTEALVEDFADFLRAKRFRTNTINCYLSSLRAIFNTAVRDRKVGERLNPFRHLRLGREVTVKRAVPPETVCRIADMELQDEPELERTADLAIFSFCAFGMPFADMSRLRKENIQGEELVYHRKKTGAQIRVGITPGMRSLIERYKSDDSPYLFPSPGSGIEEGDERERHVRYKAELTRYNRSLGEIGRRLGLAGKLTSYVMRHTWASAALACHVPVAVISQAMGHTSEKTTRFYLSQLDQSEINKANLLMTRGVDAILLKRG
ncbi:tyrosine-type recombinase/integrase [Parabacteroides sp.]